MYLKLVDLVLILLRHRKIFIVNFLLFSVVSAVISLLLPFWYTSTARLLPPESKSPDLLGLASAMLDLPFEIPNVGGLMATPSDLYIAIMRSRNVRENVLRKLNLQSYFEADYIEDALEMLDSRTLLDKTEENIIVVQCTERSPELAQKMVAAYLEELDRVNREVRRTSASYTREFIEKRLMQAEADLKEAANRLARFQSRYGAIDIEAQVKSQIEAAADLRAQLILLEVKKEVLGKYVSANHDELKNLKFQIDEMEKQIKDLQNGISPIEDDLVLSFRAVPELAKEFLFLKKDVEVQKAIYQLLMQQYEQAKIQEAKDSPTIQILDAPTLPQKRSKPKRSIIVIVSAMVSVIFSFIVVWIKIVLEHLAANDPEKYNDLVSSLKSFYKLS